MVHQFHIVPFYVYILRSESTSRFYVGHTDDLARRLAEHNGNGSRYTRNRGPWVLVHAEEHDTRAKAMRRERSIKRMKSRLYIEELVRASR